jgi:hypothetical protein
MKVKINDQEVVLDTQAKMLRHLNCMSDEDQQKDVYDRLFKLGKHDAITLRIEAADIAEWMRYEGPKVESTSILSSL